MRKLIILIISILSTTIVAMATKWSAETLPMPYLQDNRRYVSNPDGILSPVAEDSTNLMLKALENKKGIQAIVVVVKQIKGDDPYEFGMELCRKYGIGTAKQKTGLVLILATEDRSYQILTGDGLEGTLPDAICRRIQNKVMVPRLKQHDWDNAIVNTIKAISSYIYSDNTIEKEESNEDEAIGAGLGIAFAVLVVFITFYIIDQRKHRCPKCKKRMHLFKQENIRIVNSNIYKIKTIYRCPHCGHQCTIYKDTDNFNSGGPIPPILFGGGGRGSGGGFTGGTFGGGTFSGGGSGGRF